MPPTTTKAPEHEQGSVSSWSELAGFPIDPGEETPELSWPWSVQTYERMRRDSQVAAVLAALTLPLRRDIHFLEPAGARPQVVEHIARDLDLPIAGQPRFEPVRRRDRFSWAEHNRLRLLSVIFGHAFFEQVAVVEDGVAHLHKLAPRFPATIARIETARDGGLVAIRQFRLGANPAHGMEPEIPIGVDALVAYSLDREGGAWQGRSLLRSAYKDWILLDRNVRVRAQTNERNGMGVPIAEAPAGTSELQLRELSTMAQRYRAGEAAGGAMPYGASLHFRGVEGTLPDVGAAIADHRTQIARSVLAQFMQLGTSQDSSGHRALGQTFLDFFTQSLDALALQLNDTTTQHAIEDIVDWNWGSNEPAPRLVAKAVDAERDISPESLVQLLKAGAIEMTDDLETFLLARYRLPPRGDGAARPLPQPPNPFGGAPGEAEGIEPVGGLPPGGGTNASHGRRRGRTAKAHNAPGDHGGGSGGGGHIQLAALDVSALPSRDRINEIDAALAAAAPQRTEAQQDAIADYTSSGYKGINEGLRENNLDADDMQVVDALDGAMAPIPEPLTVYRGIDDLKAAELANGEILTNAGYTSTAIMPETALWYSSGTVLAIELPAGQPAIYSTDESELILPRGMDFVTTGGYTVVSSGSPNVDEDRVDAVGATMITAARA